MVAWERGMTSKSGAGKTGATKAGAKRVPDDPRRAKIDADWRARHPARARAEQALRLANAQALKDWGHKANGTPETHAKHERASRARGGALARLYERGVIDDDELAWSQEIASVHERIGRDVGVRSASLETRIDCARHGDADFHEALGAVRREMAYSWWRTAARERFGADAAAAVVGVICDSLSMSLAARQGHMRNSAARKLLVDALQMWPRFLAAARRAVDGDDLAQVWAGLR